MTINRHCSIIFILLFIVFSTSLLQIVDAQQPSDSSSSSSSSPDDDYALEGSKVSPSMALIVIVLVLGFFITGCIAIYVQQCSNNEESATNINGNNRNPIKAEFRGLDKSVIESFPTFLYSDVKELKFGKDSLECAVCLNEFEEDETLRLLPKCDHVFHPDCIDAWLSAHTTCPVCRANLVPDPTESPATENESSPHFEVQVAVVVPRVMRSHSTGHSMGQRSSEDRERFTLRLPEDVRKQLMVAAEPKLKRAVSLVALPRVSSSRRGYRSGGGNGGRGEGSGSSRYARFFARSFKWTTRNNGGGNGDGDVTASKRFFGTVVTPVEGLPQLPV